jgi:hypothetical protein
MSVYLKWLEVHRQKPSKITEHWSNTLLHWAQSLRSRGFRQSELISEVNTWKEENGPLRSFERRYPPMPSDIRRAFGDENQPSTPNRFELYDERKYRERERDRDRDRNWDERREDSSRKEDRYRPSKTSKSDWVLSKSDPTIPKEFLQPPPKNYICNRCGEKGMPGLYEAAASIISPQHFTTLLFNVLSTLRHSPPLPSPHPPLLLNLVCSPNRAQTVEIFGSLISCCGGDSTCFI